MQLNVPPDLETLINKRLSSGRYATAEDVLRRALEAQDADESWTDEERARRPAAKLRRVKTPGVYPTYERLCSYASRQSGYFQYLVLPRR